MNDHECEAGRECRSDGLYAVESSETIGVDDAMARMRDEARFETLDFPAYRCKSIRWGDGPPLVLIHGMSEVAESFAMMMACLSRHFTCVAYNLPRGDGDQVRWGQIHHAELADDLLRLVEHHRLERPMLLASSFGSTIALRGLAQWPGRFPRAVFLGGFVRRRISSAERILCQFARYWKGRMRDLPFRNPIGNRTERELLQSHSRDAWEFMRRNCGSAPVSTVARQALMIAGLDLRPLLPRVKQPVLLIRGDSDRIVPAECETDLREGLINVERLEIVGCGHVPQYSHPVLTAELARRFLTGPVGCPGT